ncbi:MAG: hypothetical protein IT440_11720, partial [Phycisphaeraceae bacterium]|nr:hypothetical protein [Phycisphaeraceae bacterium]
MWKQTEHIAALFAAHDMWMASGNDLPLPAWWLQQIYRYMQWDQHVRFVGYWDLADELGVEGGQEDRVVCSLYCRPSTAPTPQVPYSIDHPHMWADFNT